MTARSGATPRPEYRNGPDFSKHDGPAPPRPPGIGTAPDPFPIRHEPLFLFIDASRLHVNPALVRTSNPNSSPLRLKKSEIEMILETFLHVNV
jgi:hypothetical protein